MMNNLPQQQDLESLSQLPKEELVKIIIEQALVNTQLLSSIRELKQEIERLRGSRDLDSKTSSKPPSTDLLKKPELKLPETEAEAASPKRKPGGQPGHIGKTRKGFSRIDRHALPVTNVCPS